MNKSTATKILKDAGFHVDNSYFFGGVTLNDVSGYNVFVSLFDRYKNAAEHYAVVTVFEVGCDPETEKSFRRYEINGSDLLGRLVLKALEAKAELDMALAA